jgi:hypothetical protein
MPEPGASLAEQYSRYTYPYSIQERIRDIKTEISRRRIDGVIHYVQAFCHRSIGDIVFRDAIDRPMLTLEGNADFFLNTHARTRLEAFLDMIQRRPPEAQHRQAIKKINDYSIKRQEDEYERPESASTASGASAD